MRYVIICIISLILILGCTKKRTWNIVLEPLKPMKIIPVEKEK